MLYRLFQGPIATTLENKREPFLPVDPVAPGKNMYPWGVKKEEVETYLNAHPEKHDEIMGLRTVVRRLTLQNLTRDLNVLTKYPALDTLHQGLKQELRSQLLKLDRSQGAFYAVPYSVNYADELMKAYGLLNEAADALEKDDGEFARYLRNRARDLLSDDYESGDAAWVTGHFKNLNAQIGSYETYDDELYGVKTFFAFSLLATRQQETSALRQAMKLVAEQFVIGRGWSETAALDLGHRVLRGNVASNIDLKDILDGGFNGRLSEKLLATVDELKDAGGDGR
jgi:hypothetical protein